MVTACSLQMSLNPYSIGRYSMRYNQSKSGAKRMSLNPYSNGRYSMGRWNSLSKDWFLWVLILILMEDTLWATKIDSVTINPES